MTQRDFPKWTDRDADADAAQDQSYYYYYYKGGGRKFERKNGILIFLLHLRNRRSVIISPQSPLLTFCTSSGLGREAILMPRSSSVIVVVVVVVVAVIVR